MGGKSVFGAYGEKAKAFGAGGMGHSLLVVIKVHKKLSSFSLKYSNILFS